MRTLIIPDVHEDLDKLAAALSKVDASTGRVVFLGDWFDTYAGYDPARLRLVCKFINENIDGFHTEDTRVLGVDFLLGNHDVHYFFDHPGYPCSGFDPRKKKIIRELINTDTIRKFKLFTTVGPFTCSHAGFVDPVFVKQRYADEVLENALAGKYDPMLGAGRARGGRQRYGGPTWLDWNYEFEPIPGLPQIVGHTMDHHVRTETASDGTVSYCIDTVLRRVAIVDEDTGEVEIVKVYD